MFKNLLRELEELKHTTTITVPIAADERGYVDRECPSEECRYQFKVLESDWRDLFRDEAVFCPMCGHQASSDQWWTTEQIEEAKKETLEHLKSRVNSALHRDAREFNRAHPDGGLIRISMRMSGAEHRHVMLPIQAADVLEQCISCDACGVRYAVVGAAFFCPCCGHNSVDRMFRASVQKVRSTVDNIDLVRSAVAEASGRDDAETLCRSLLEDGLQHCVTAFQHYAEARYRTLPGVSSPRMNVFQRLDEGDELWRASVGAGYGDWLLPQQRIRLTVLFERRHLLAHRNGIVDERYVAKSGDTTHRPGQRIVVTARDVLELVDLVEHVGDAIRRATC